MKVVRTILVTVFDSKAYSHSCSELSQLMANICLQLFTYVLTQLLAYTLTVDSMVTLTAAGLYAHSYLKSLIFEALPKPHWLESRFKDLVCILLLNSFNPENGDETSGTVLLLS